jgi:hypothetical protein
MNRDILATWWLVIGCVTALIAWLAYWDYRKKRLQFEERRIAIENGMEPPPLPPKQLDGWPGVKQRELELKAQERRLRIEKGLPVEEERAVPKTRLDYLRRGLLAIGVGAGLALAYVGLSMSPTGFEGRNDALAWCIGLAPIAFLYGVANVIYQRFAPAAASGDERHP